MSKNILMVFMKAPIPGYVKTRLAVDLGNEKAASFYIALSERILLSIRSTRYNTVILYDPPHQGELFKQWLGSDCCLEPQSTGNLGCRLTQGFEKFFQDGADAVIAIGTDCPDLDESDITSAFNKLEKYASVIGPALDGGYYLIGFSRTLYDRLSGNLASIFDDVAWSTSTVYQQTLEKLNHLRIECCDLQVKRDIDTLSDYQAYLSEGVRG